MMADKQLTSTRHSLFIEQIPELRKHVKEDMYKVIPARKIYHFYIGLFDEEKRGIHDLIHELRKADPFDELSIRINSPGGLLSEIQQFYNLIEDKFRGRSTAYLDPCGYSCGALLFCMCDRRVIYPHSDIMFHDFAMGFYGKSDEMDSYISHTTKNLRSFFQDIFQGFLSEKEIENLVLGKDLWLDTKDMCRRKIATHVILDGKDYTSDQYMKLLKGKKKK
jgi:ATP-dependent protease ClpP protease subunit